jgi:hypothetical protein
MRTIIITALLPFSLLAQFKIGQIRIIPTTDGTAVGQIEFDTTRADGNAVVLKAPNTATASYTLTLPTAAPASNGHCLTGTTAGVLSFAACPGAGAVLTTTNQEVEGFKYFGVSGSDRLVMYRIADNQMGFQTMLDGQTDPTTYSYGGVQNQLLLQPRAGVVGIGAVDTSFLLNVAGTFRATGATTLGSTLAVAGITTLSADLGFGTDNTHAIGQTGTRPSVVYSRIDNTAKLEIADLSGGFWDQRVNAGGTTSDWTLRDNAGSRALVYTRVFSSSPDNAFEVFGTVLPAQRATGSGDAVNDSTAPSLGATGRRWAAVWAAEGTFTSEVKSPTFTASADFTGASNNVTNVGTSSVRMASVWTTGLNASGTITFPTGAASGRVWTSDASGNGSWVVAAGAGAVLTTTNQEVEGFKYFGVSGSDRLVMYMIAANQMGLQTMLDGQTDPTTYSYGGVQNQLLLQPRAGVVGIGAVDTSFVLNVAGTFRATGAATLSSTLGVAGLSTLTGGATFGAALSASATDTHDIGSATRFRAIYGKSVNAESLEIANSTFVTTFWRHSLNSAATYRIESGSGSQIEMQMGTISSTSSDVGFRGTLYPLSTSGSNGDLGFSGTPWRALYLSTGFRLTSGAAAGRVLTSDASGNGSWVAPSSGTVTSIATTLPISGGTITTTGTISCPTCATTDTNQTITATKTFQASFAAAASDTYDIGSATRFRAIYGKAVNAESLEIANSTFVTTFWRHSLNSAATYRISSGSGGQIEMQMGTTSSTQSDVGFRGTLYPLSTAGSNGDVGFSGTPWRTLYLSTSSFMNGTQWMDSSRNLTNLGTGTFGGSITANGGISTASGTNSTMYVGSGNLYLRTFSGADASCSGVTNGWVGFRTDTDELQVCNGGSVKKVSLL